ncbi:hypothetical protein Agub_g14432 [Astrephomene gubernaculifera]|uniref:DUF4378 domain-containing protein n=1 Tax=Astrephomene gubernaculifera TaxID=47775 RepID=A0AAD3HSC0_9CHLO|nr:hypothetical protein Agub_g14432 [Astrephomene gubernaculifera]
MPLPASQGLGEDSGVRGKSGHVSGRVISNTRTVKGSPTGNAEGGRMLPIKASEELAGLTLSNSQPAMPPSTAGRGRRSTSASSGAPTSEDSFDAAPPRRQPHPINAELVKLVASHAPLELAQLAAVRQKARLKKAHASSTDSAAAAGDGVQTEDYVAVQHSYEPEPLQEAAALQADLGHARLLMRPAAANTAVPTSAAASRPKSRSPSRPSHLPAAPAKGATVKRDQNLLPNPVAAKQAQLLQRQAAAAAFAQNVQREQDLLRAEKERRLKAEQDALAAQLAEAAEAAKSDPAEVAQAPDHRPAPPKRKKSVSPSRVSGAAALHGLQAAATGQDLAEKKAADPRPWRQGMRKKSSVSHEAPAVAPPEAVPKPNTDPPPPRNVSPCAAAVRTRTLDPVARSQLKEFTARKAKEMAEKLKQEKTAQLEARTAHLRIMKEQMAKARERAQKYAETAKERPAEYKEPRPAWVDIAVDAAPATAQHVPLNRSADVMAGLAQQRRQGEDALHTVVRAQEADGGAKDSRAGRASTAPRTRPANAGRSLSAQPVKRQPAKIAPAPAEVLRAAELGARLAARKQYDERVREMQAAERRDSSRGRDTYGRDTSRGRLRSPTAGRKHHSASLRSPSRSPSKRPKQQARRSRSGSRAGSAQRRRPNTAGHAPVAAAASGGSGNNEQRTPGRQVARSQSDVQDPRRLDGLWDLALQLSARLGAMEQGGYRVQQRPMQAWPEAEGQQLTEEQHQFLLLAAQQQQELDRLYLESAAGAQPGYPYPVAVVPTGLPSDPVLSPMDAGLAQAAPSRPHVHVFDEGVEANIEFRSEVSWPTAAHKKLRTNDGSGYAGSNVDGAAGGPVSLHGTDSLASQYQADVDGRGAFSGADISMAGSVSALTEDHVPANVAIQTGGSLLASDVTSVRGRAQGAAGGQEQVAAGRHSNARSASQGSHGSGKRRMDEDQEADVLPLRKHVPAAPVIQIPMPAATSQAAAVGVEPSLGLPTVVGLPYDNATFSAESADDDGNSSGGEGAYGQRVLSIAELHGVLEENPLLAQRLSLERERTWWEERPATDSPSRISIAKRTPRQRNAVSEGSGIAVQRRVTSSMSYCDADDSSTASSAPGSPARACEAVVKDYEMGNNALQIRPVKTELLKAQAAKQAEEQREREFALENGEPEEEEGKEELPMAPFTNPGDPMSIINLVAHKGRLPARPAVIQLSEPPLSGPRAAEQESQAVQTDHDVLLLASGARPASKVLLIPGPHGTDLVFSRALVQPQVAQPSTAAPPTKELREIGVGEGHIGASDRVDSSAQQLTDSLPPFVLLPATMHATARVTPANSERESGQSPQQLPLQPQPSMQQLVGEVLAGAPQAEPAGMAGAEPAQPGAYLGMQRPGGAAAGTEASDGQGGCGSNGVSGVMASPPMRPRMVTFLDEVQGPPERVRLAPNELFRQMQDTLKTYEELDAAELELQQVQNARAIAAVQREAHRIAQRLDQTSAAETQLHLVAQVQANMDAKLQMMEESLRSEVRKESLGQLHNVTSLFVEQLNRNKVVHAAVQTRPDSPPAPRPEIGVQVEPSVGRLPLTTQPSNSSPAPQQQSPSLRSNALSQSPHASRLPDSPAQLLLPQTSLRASPDVRPFSLGQEVLGGRSTATSNAASDYTADFEEDGGLSNSNAALGRTSSRVTYRQTSRISVPESVYEEDEEEEDVIEEEDAAAHRSRHASSAISVPESVSHYQRDRKPSRATIRLKSTGSIPESVPSERTLSQSPLRQQASSLSVPESVYDEEDRPSRVHTRSALRQASTVSVAESVRSERTAATSTRGVAITAPAGERHSTLTVATSVPYSSIAGEDSKASSSVQESLPQPQASGSFGNIPSSSSRRRRSTAADTVGTSEPNYSTDFDNDYEEDDDGVAEEIAEGSVSTMKGAGNGSSAVDEVEEEPSEPSNAGRHQQQQQGRRTATTVSFRSVVEEEEDVRTEQPSSYSEEADTSGRLASEESVPLQQQQQRPPQKPQQQGASRGQHASPAGPLGAVTDPRVLGGTAMAAAGQLNLQTLISGGIKLDDAMMAWFMSDAEARMRQELEFLTGRLHTLNASAAARMAELEADLTNESDAQRRHVIMREQRLLQVQHDADAADLNRQISAVKADYARQQLVLEQAFRLAQVIAPSAAAFKKPDTTSAAGKAAAGLQASSRAPAASPSLAKGAGATPKGAHANVRQAGVSPAAQQRHASATYSSIVSEEKPVKESLSGSVLEEQDVRQPASASDTILTDRSGQRRQTASSSVLEENVQGHSGSAASGVPSEYSDDYDPPSASQSRQSRPSHRQTGSIVAEIEESLSQRRTGTSGGQSQSVISEEDADQSSETGEVRSRAKQQHSSGSVAVTEPQYSEDFADSGPVATAPLRSDASQRQASTISPSDHLDGGASELSALSADLERKQAELQRLLRRKEKEMRDQERRAKLLAKQAAVEELQKKLAALEQRERTAAATAAVRPLTHGSPAAARPAKDQSSKHTSQASIPDDAGSTTPRSLPEEPSEGPLSIASESSQDGMRGRRDQSSDGSRRHRSSSPQTEVTESVAYTDDNESVTSASVSESASQRQQSDATTSGVSSEDRAAHRLRALQQAIAAKEKALRRLQREAQEEELQRRLRDLEEQEKSLKSKPPPKPPKAPAAAALDTSQKPANRKAAPSYGASGDSAVYSEDFNASGSGSAAAIHSTSSVLDELPKQRGTAAGSGSRSASVAEEYSSRSFATDSGSAPKSAHGQGGRSSSIPEDEASRGASGVSRSSGGAVSSSQGIRSAGHGSTSGSADVYEDSFEAPSTHGGSPHASGIQEEASFGGKTSSESPAGVTLDPIREEEDPQSASVRSSSRLAASRASGLVPDEVDGPSTVGRSADGGSSDEGTDSGDIEEDQVDAMDDVGDDLQADVSAEPSAQSLEVSVAEPSVSQESSLHNVASVQEFFTTAEVNSPSVAPSIHSAELAGRSGSAVTADGSQQGSLSVREFMTTADALGASVAPSIHSSDLVAAPPAQPPAASLGASLYESNAWEQESLPSSEEEEKREQEEDDEPIVLEQRSLSSSSGGDDDNDEVEEEEEEEAYVIEQPDLGSSSESMQESSALEHPGAPAGVTDDSNVYSADVADTGLEDNGGSGVTVEGAEVEELDVEYSVAEEDEEVSTQAVSVAGASQDVVSDLAGMPGNQSSASGDVVDDVAVQQSAVSAATGASPEVEDLDDYELDFQASAIEAEEVVQSSLQYVSSKSSSSVSGSRQSAADIATTMSIKAGSAQLPQQASLLSVATYDEDFEASEPSEAVLSGQAVVERTGLSAVEEEGDTELRQDASASLAVRSSLREVASNSSLGASRPSAADIATTGSIRAGSVSMQQQASVVSTTAYDEDFEEGEVSEANLTGAVAAERTSLSVVDEEGDTDNRQDGSTLVVQSSLHDVSSGSSLGANQRSGDGDLAETAATSIKAGSLSPQQQASTVSNATYEEDFEEGEPSEVQLTGPTVMERTTLSVVQEEGETELPQEPTGSRLYSEDFASASTLLPAAASGVSAAPAAAAATAPTSAAPATQSPLASSVESAAEDVLDDVEVDYAEGDEGEDDAEEEEETYGTDKFESASGAPMGPVLQASTVGMEVSQRYGPASNSTSAAYSADFPETAEQGEEADAEAADSYGEVSSEMPAKSSILSARAPDEAADSGVGRQTAGVDNESAAPAAPVLDSGKSAAAEAAGRSATESGSVFSVDEEAISSAALSSEQSSGMPPMAAVAQPDISEPAAGPAAAVDRSVPAISGRPSESMDAYGDDYSRDFTGLSGDLETDAANRTSAPAMLLDTADSASQQRKEAQENAAASGLGEDDLAEDVEEDLDVSGSGLGGQTSFTGEPSVAALTTPEVARRPSASAVAAEGSTSGISEEESGMISVPRGRGIRQTRKIESRAWRTQESLLAEEEGAEGELDLVDMSMVTGEGSGLLEMLGADLIEAASGEILTPSTSLRSRAVGELTSGTSSASLAAQLRPTASFRLATLRESQAYEGEEPEVTSGTRAPPPEPEAETLGGKDKAEAVSGGRGDEEEGGQRSLEADDVVEDVADVVPEGSFDGDADDAEEYPFKRQPPVEVSKPGERAAVPLESSPETGAAVAAAAVGQAPGAGAEGAASGGESGLQSSEGFEAPASEDSGGRQSVEEYDVYTSAALAADDSDDLAQYAAAFASQAIGVEGDEDAPADVSGGLASGLSEDLGQYTVPVQPDSEEETEEGQAPVPSAADVATAASQQPQPELEPTPSVGATEVVDEDLEVADEVSELPGNGPFSVDESSDRFPVLMPSTSVGTPSHPHLPPAAMKREEAPFGASAAAPQQPDTAGPPEVKVSAGDEPSSPTVSSPASRQSSRGGLPEETSLGPLPRSGLVAGEEDEDAQGGLEYRAVYQPEQKTQATVPPSAAEDSAAETPSASPRHEVDSGAVEAREGAEPKSNYLEELRAFAGSDEDELEEFGSGHLASRGLSAATLAPAVQALLNQPDAEPDVPKGDFESEIAEMLAASHSKSRLVSPYQSRDLGGEPGAQTPEATTPFSLSARPSMAGTPEPASDSKDDLVDQITELTAKELLTDAVETMVSLAELRAAAPAAFSTQPADSAFLTATTVAAIASLSPSPSPPLQDRRISAGGEASISMSMDDLEGDIELDIEQEDEEEVLDLPSPLQSDSGSLGSPSRPAYEPPGPSNLSSPSTGTHHHHHSAAPELAPEQSDMALNNANDTDASASGGAGLTSEEDDGWGGDYDVEDPDWKPDLDGYISPELDRRVIERENAPAVATTTEAVAEYAEHVLQEFMQNRPEFLVAGAEPLRLEGFLDQERRLADASEAQHIHNKMVYDAINEALLAIYRSANRVQSPPWLSTSHIVKPLPSPEDMAALVQKQLRDWSAMRMRDATETDKVLAADAQEDERAWCDLAAEEAEVQREVAELIWDGLVEDTAAVLSELEGLLGGTTSGGAAASSASGPAGRRRMETLRPTRLFESFESV